MSSPVAMSSETMDEVVDAVFEPFMDHVDPLGRLVKWDEHDHEQIKGGLRIVIATAVARITGEGA